MIRILVADKLAKEGVNVLENAKDVEVETHAPITEDQLVEKVRHFDGMIVRSATKVTAKVLENPGRLKAIARAGVGVDTIDVATATRKGVLVMNTPGGNTLATAEQTFALILAMCRHTPQAVQSLKAGKWERSRFMGTQLAGKTLGVIGLGRIGQAVANRALAFEMNVLGYDPYFALPPEKVFGGRVKMVDDLTELCRNSDIITVHTPLTDQTRGLIGKEQFALMPDGVRVVNCARAGIIDEQALYEALQSGKVAAAALDVYSTEPPDDRRLIELENVVCTPHLGASAKEAQISVAVDAGKQLIHYLTTGEPVNAVNAPGYDKSVAAALKPYGALAQRMGTILGHVTSGRVLKLTATYRGELAELDTSYLTTNLTVALLQGQTDEPVNAINAAIFARERGIEIQEIKNTSAGDFTNLIEAELTTDKGRRTLAGTLFSKTQPRIVAIDNYRMEMVPAGRMIITFNDDAPGVIGSVGSLFGKHGINIGSLTFGRQKETQKAVMVLTLDSEPDRQVMDQMAGLPFMDSVHFIHLPPLDSGE